MREMFVPPTGSSSVAPLRNKKNEDAIEKKIREKLLVLPVFPKPLGNYLPTVRSGNWLIISGQLPLVDNSLGSYKGRLGKEITIDAGQRAAKQCTLNALALAKLELGSLEKIKKVLKLTGYVAGMPGFNDQAIVLNGASDLLVDLFEENGKHARVAVGVTDLPRGACVEIEYLLEVR